MEKKELKETSDSEEKDTRSSGIENYVGNSYLSDIKKISDKDSDSEVIS